MIWVIPILNAAFGWLIISALSWFLIHPIKRKNFFIAEVQGFIPKNLNKWGIQLGGYVSQNFFSISRLKESILEEENLRRIHSLLEEKVDNFLKNKLKEKIPIFSMFVTDSLILQMKEILTKELEQMVPDLINFFADDLQAKYDMNKLISEKLSSLSTEDLKNKFYTMAGKNILQLKVCCAFFGGILGLFEIFLLHLNR